MGWRKWLVSLVVFGLLPTGCGASAGPNDVVIGFQADLTGTAANTGDLQRKAANLAAEEINAAGGVNGRTLKLLVEDNASTNAGTVAAFNKLVGEKALVVLGPVRSTEIQAVSDIIQDKGVPTAMGGTNCGLTHAGNTWLTRFRPDDCIMAAALAAAALEDLHGQKIAIIHDTDAFGTGGKDEIVKYLQRKGMEPATIQPYTTGSENFQPQMQAVASSGADALIIYATNPSDVAKIYRTRKELGVTVKAIGSPSTGQTATIDLAQDTLDGIYVGEDYTPSARLDHYREAWKAKYNTNADTLSAWTYDALYVIADALKQANTNDPKDRQRIQDAIMATQGYQGVIGEISFDQYGNGIHTASISQFTGTTKNFVRVVKPEQ